VKSIKQANQPVEEGTKTTIVKNNLSKAKNN